MAKAASVDDFDYIQLIIYDVHGLPKGRVMAKRRLAGIMKNGLGIYGGICFPGIREEISNHDDFGERNNFSNKNLKPLLDTLKPCPQFGQGKYKIGQVICNLEYLDGRLDVATPRTSAEIQIARLQTELGLTIKSAFEIEFTIKETKSQNYYGHINKFSDNNIIENCQGLLYDLVHALDERGVPVDSLQTEYGPGQFEFTLDVAEGIQAPDTTIGFRNIAKTFLKSRGYDAIFMTVADPGFGNCNGFHFNHSLYTSKGENALVDVTKPNKLSELGCHWLAGLIEHAPAMTAFCNPTINCYRRMGAPFAPNYANWSYQGRRCSYRLKVERGDNVYIENRLSSSASNPYLVLTCTIAAGMDGVLRKLPLPDQLEQKIQFPKDLESALKALEADTVLRQAMGDKLVEYFIHTKRTYELKEFAAFGPLTPEELLKKEHEFYLLNV